MHVLHLASWYPNEMQPFSGDFIQRHLTALSSFLPVNVIAVFKDENMQPGSLRHDKVEVNEFFTERISYYGTNNFKIKLLTRFVSFIRYKNIVHQLFQDYLNLHGKPDLIHVHVSMNMGLIALYLKKKYKIPYVITEHSTIFQDNAAENIYNLGFFWRFQLKRVLKFASCIYPVSVQLMNKINQLVPSQNFRVISNVVDTDLFFLNKENISERFKLLHVSGLNFQKNPHGILSTLKLLSKVRQDWVCHIVGPADDTLKTLCTSYNLDHFVCWEGEVSYNEVSEFMRNSDLMILFSRYENQPCVILEALCCGLPVVSTNVGGIGEIINSTNGVLLENQSVESLLEGICYILENYRKFDRKSISKYHSELCSYKTIGLKFIQTYKEILAN